VQNPVVDEAEDFVGEVARELRHEYEPHVPLAPASGNARDLINRFGICLTRWAERNSWASSMKMVALAGAGACRPARWASSTCRVVFVLLELQHAQHLRNNQVSEVGCIHVAEIHDRNPPGSSSSRALMSSLGSVPKTLDLCMRHRRLAIASHDRTSFQDSGD